jgi:late competence protein required for DNA uptake (superfamily II DNA/RNA helicase)
MLRGILFVFLCVYLVGITSCIPDKKQKQMQFVTIENNKLKCKRCGWNRQHPSAGYVNNVVMKQEYKPVRK